MMTDLRYALCSAATCRNVFLAPAFSPDSSSVVLMLAAAVTGFIPARRALHLDPAMTLRSE